MATTFLSPIVPKTNAPLCPCTVDTGKFGISLYGNVNFTCISSVKLPNPEPKITPYSGVKSILSLI